MSSLFNIWREIGSYLRYANARNLALITINASLIALITASLTTNTVNPALLFLKPSVIVTATITILLGLSQLILFLSFSPILNRSRVIRSRWIFLAQALHLNPPDSIAEERNPFFFSEISQFDSPATYFKHLKMNYTDLVGESTDEHPAAFACAQQIWIVSTIASKKFAQFSLALSLVWIAVLAYALFLITHFGALLCPLA